MGIPLAVGQIYRVTFDLTMFGQKLMNTFSYRLKTIGAEADSDALGTAMDTVLSAGLNLQSKYLAIVSPQVTLANTWIQLIYPSRVRKQIFLKGIAGAAAGTSQTANVAVSVERFGGLANRHNVGRVQIPACDDAGHISNGVISGVLYLADINTFATQMKQSITTLGASVLEPVLVPRAGGPTFQLISGTIVQSTVRVMRRRTVGVGK
jgi:hypothetical protein